MSGLLKAGAAAHDMRILRAAEPGVDAEIAALRLQLEQLEARLLASEVEVDRLTLKSEDAYAEGKAEGLRESQDTASVLIQRMQAGIASAQQKLGDALAGSERLAALLARECLDKMFAETKDRALLVCDLITTQMRTLERSAVLAIKVSALDFPDSDARARIADRDLAGVHVETDDTLPSGSCEMFLRLGQIDIGLDQQWSVLAGTLAGFADPEPDQ